LQTLNQIDEKHSDIEKSSIFEISNAAQILPFVFFISKYPLYVLQKPDKLNNTVGTKYFQKTQFILTFIKG